MRIMLALIASLALTPAAFAQNDTYIVQDLHVQGVSSRAIEISLGVNPASVICLGIR